MSSISRPAFLEKVRGTKTTASALAMKLGASENIIGETEVDETGIGVLAKNMHQPLVSREHTVRRFYDSVLLQWYRRC